MLSIITNPTSVVSQYKSVGITTKLLVPYNAIHRERCAEFSNAIHRERCAEFSLFLSGGGKVRKICLYEKNILFASKKTHSCRNTSKMCLFEPRTAIHRKPVLLSSF
ncbi:hypothetical protein [Leptospira interrogans]|uniref:hypothetical protein n=1 Tax=Leptospira interrogans TaxID=173 RepID=UPI0012FAFE7E|nr:hypothetical protein [Leptospira interrogans]